MKKIILGLLGVILFSALAVAKDLPEDILVLLPSRIENFIAETPRTYQDKRLGASLGYNTSDHITVTIYIYDQGVQNIEDGVGSEIIKISKESAMEEIIAYERMGYWRNVNKVADKETEFDIGEGKKLKVLYVSYSCDAIDGYSENYIPTISDLYITGVKDYICKMRISRPVGRDEAEIQNVIETVLAEINNN